MGGVITHNAHSMSSTTWDLIVVGGGVYGVCTALEAARRGLKPIVLERNDFGSETTWNSLRIVHGGLRYLQGLDMRRFQESVAERRWFLKYFPDFVEPMACLMPLYGDGLRRPSVMGVALVANHVLSASRNRGVLPESTLPAGRVLGREQTHTACPSIRVEGLRGGALWFDAAMPDSQCLLIALLRSACRLGASAVNKVNVEGVTVEDGRVTGVAARPADSSECLHFRAPVVANCAGPWSRSFARDADRDLPELFRPSLAFNLLLKRPPLATPAVAAAAPRKGARTYFLTPWKEHLFAGTYHAPCTNGVTGGAPTSEQVGHMLSELNEAIPSLDLCERDVLRVHWGLLPATEEGTDALAVRPRICDHALAGGPHGLVSISGVKWTTARRVASAAIELMFPGRRIGTLQRDGSPPPPSWAEFRTLATADRAAARAVVARIMLEEAPRDVDDIVLRRTDWGSIPADADEARTMLASIISEHSLRFTANS